MTSIRKIMMIGFISLALSASFAFADDDGGDCHGNDCHPKTKDVCFNVVCHYEFHDGSDSVSNNDHDRHICSAASTFTKKVTEDGGEVPEQVIGVLNVACDGESKFNNSATVSTDLLGTRIQGLIGPTPAVLLPRGALDSGVEGRNGGHYTSSILEVDFKGEFKRAEGKCFIWNGNEHHHDDSNQPEALLN